jgi:hypothetical protein
MGVNLLSLLNIYFGERFIAGTHGCFKSFVIMRFYGESFRGSKNLSFLNQYAGYSRKWCIRTQDEGEHGTYILERT